MDRKFMILKKKLTPGVILTMSWGDIVCVYDHYSRTSLCYVSQISGEPLQDHWSSGLLMICFFEFCRLELYGTWRQNCWTVL